MKPHFPLKAGINVATLAAGLLGWSLAGSLGHVELSPWLWLQWLAQLTLHAVAIGWGRRHLRLIGGIHTFGLQVIAGLLGGAVFSAAIIAIHLTFLAVLVYHHRHIAPAPWIVLGCLQILGTMMATMVSFTLLSPMGLGRKAGHA